MTKILV